MKGTHGFSGMRDTRPVPGDNQRKAGHAGSGRTDAFGEDDNRPRAEVEANRGHIRPPKMRRNDDTRSVY